MMVNRRRGKHSRNTLRHSCIFITAFVFTLVLVLGIILVSSDAYADNSGNAQVKKYKSVVIYSGDTLSTIASGYYCDECISMNRYIKEIASINNISVDTSLTPGNHIIVPYYD